MADCVCPRTHSNKPANLFHSNRSSLLQSQLSVKERDARDAVAALIDTRKRSARMLETVESKLRTLEDELSQNQLRATGLVVTIQQYSVRMAQREGMLEAALSESVFIKAEVQRLQEENARLKLQQEERARELLRIPALVEELERLREELDEMQDQLEVRLRGFDLPMLWK